MVFFSFLCTHFIIQKYNVSTDKLCKVSKLGEYLTYVGCCSVMKIVSWSYVEFCQYIRKVIC